MSQPIQDYVQRLLYCTREVEGAPTPHPLGNDGKICRGYDPCGEAWGDAAPQFTVALSTADNLS
jgi:hypothetical protein